MPDRTLHGNGENCPACALRRDELRRHAGFSQAVPCNFCGGKGRVERPAADIIREAVEWAAEFYWPERDARWREINAEAGS